MRKILIATAILGAMTTTVAAEPLRLTEAQMEGVTAAGVLDNFSIEITVLPQVGVANGVAVSNAIGVLANNISALAIAIASSANSAGTD